ncbi:MAG: hypothetical protein QM626_05335 [Microbacterium sp.]|uniref:hypothetical protein n=1 Tax=Microbacterium sp. TaxID=51671 RepID=UPI0039E43F81
MTLPSVLVIGPELAGAPVARALVRRGWEVVLADPAGTPADVELATRMREDGVELRLGTTLLGWLDLDTHVEAELSDGRVENFDLIVDADPASTMPAGARIVALPADTADPVGWADVLPVPGSPGR